MLRLPTQDLILQTNTSLYMMRNFDFRPLGLNQKALGQNPQMNAVFVVG
jgi:hypothetical protein